MILFLEEDNRIYAYNDILPKEVIVNYDNAVWYDGEFSFTMAKFIEGKTSVYYFRDGKVEIEYFDNELPEEPELTYQELITAELLLNQADILAKQNEHDEVLAEILLNQMGV